MCVNVCVWGFGVSPLPLEKTSAALMSHLLSLDTLSLCLTLHVV